MAAYRADSFLLKIFAKAATGDEKVNACSDGSSLLKMLANAAATKGDKKVNAYSDGSSWLKMLAKAATTKGDRKVKTRASARGKYCREPYIVAMLAKPTTPRSVNSHFLQNFEIEHSNNVSNSAGLSLNALVGVEQVLVKMVSELGGAFTSCHKYVGKRAGYSALLSDS